MLSARQTPMLAGGCTLHVGANKLTLGVLYASCHQSKEEIVELLNLLHIRLLVCLVLQALHTHTLTLMMCHTLSMIAKQSKPSYPRASNLMHYHKDNIRRTPLCHL